MAKIEFFKPRGQVTKGRKIKSIVGENYANNYKERLKKQSEIAHQNHKARIKAEEVGVLKNAKQEEYIVRMVQEIQIIIIPQFSLSSEISISDDEADKIVQIICEEKDKTSKRLGYIIAERIGTEVNQEKICSVEVDGGEGGLTWIIKVSNCPILILKNNTSFLVLFFIILIYI